MAIDSGRLRHRIAIQEYQFIEQDSSTGEEKRDWVSIHECWAAIEPVSAREFVAAQAAQSKVTARVTIRHVDGIDASMRIVHKKHGKDVIYNIEGVLADKDSGLEYLTLPCSKGVSIDGR